MSEPTGASPASLLVLWVNCLGCGRTIPSGTECDVCRLISERDTARGLCVALEGELARLRELMNGLCSDAGELLRGWDARKSQRRIGGMGSNIATEDAGRFTSIYYWERLRTAVKAARAALGHAEQGEG